MPHTSQRGQLMPESPIRKLVPLADKAKARGVKVYHLNIGQPDLKTPQVALDTLKNIDLKILEYSQAMVLKVYAANWPVITTSSTLKRRKKILLSLPEVRRR